MTRRLPKAGRFARSRASAVSQAPPTGEADMALGSPLNGGEAGRNAVLRASATDPRRSSFNANWMLVDGQWVEAPLPQAANVGRSPHSAPPELVLADGERAILASPEAKARAAAAAERQDQREAEQAEQAAERSLAAVDAFFAARYGGLMPTLADMPWLTESNTERVRYSEADREANGQRVAHLEDDGDATRVSHLDPDRQRVADPNAQCTAHLEERQRIDAAWNEINAKVAERAAARRNAA